MHIIYTHANFESYALNDRSLRTVLTAKGPTIPLGSSIVRIEIKGINSKPLKLELKDVLHLPSTPINLFLGQLFKKYTRGGYLKKGVLYTGSNEPVALIETTESGHFLKVVKEPIFTYVLLSLVELKPLVLWYKRLLYTSLDRVKETVQIIKGISIKASQSELGLYYIYQVANSI